MAVVNWQKAILLGLSLVAVVVLGIADVLPPEAVSGALMTVLGYVAGNTVGAKKADPITPVIGRRENPEV